MALPRYLALTAAEFTACSPIPAFPAWMACHFSPYGTGLCDLPPELPDNAMVILNDRIPPHRHDGDYILQQLSVLSCDAILLDFQRPHSEETVRLAQLIVEGETRPVGVTPQYCRNLSCPVFLPPVPPDVSPKDYFVPWQGREIWLEASLDGLLWTVTEQGSRSAPLPCLPDNGQKDEALFCHYRIELPHDRAEFSLWRTPEDLNALLEAATAFGVTRAVGLWQELGES